MNEIKDLTKEERAIILDYIFNGIGALPDIMPFIKSGEEAHYHELKHAVEDFPSLLEKNRKEAVRLIRMFEEEMRKTYGGNVFDHLDILLDYSKLCIKRKQIIDPRVYAAEVRRTSQKYKN